MRYCVSFLLVLLWPAVTWAQCNQNCNYYLSSSGTDTPNSSGCTLGSPCSTKGLIDNTPPIPPGSNVCVIDDGIYAGADYRFEFGDDNAQLQGAPGNPITFCALTTPFKVDGGAFQQALYFRTDNPAQPVQYITMEDFWAFNNVSATDQDGPIGIETNPAACPGTSTCYTNNITIKRGVIWSRNPSEANAVTLGTVRHIDTLMEDIAIIQSRERKGWDCFSGLRCTARRITLVYLGRTKGANPDNNPKRLWDSAYHSFDTIAENTISIHVGSDLDENQVNIASGPYGRQEAGIDAARFGIPEREVEKGDDDRTQVLGNLILIEPSTFVPTGNNMFRGLFTVGRYGQNSPTSLSDASNTWRHNFVYYDPSLSGYATFEPFAIREYDGNTRVSDGSNCEAPEPENCFPNMNIYEYLTSITGGSSTVHSSQTARVTNLNDYPTLAAMPPGETLYEGTVTANLCKRYQDGVLTNEGLWPWPMTQSILDAHAWAQAQGHNLAAPAVNVDALVTGIFGAPPTACTTSGPGPSTSTSRMNNAILRNGALR